MSFSLSKLNPLRMPLPVKLILMITLVLLFGGKIDLEIKRFFYAVSITLKEILVSVLPFIIFSYLASCILSFKRGVLAFITILLVAVYSSNVISTLLSYGTCSLVLGKLSAAAGVTESSHQILTPIWDLIVPSWSVSLPTWFFGGHILGPNDTALFAGLLFGILFSFKRFAVVDITVDKMKSASFFFLRRMFIPVVPLFILGFVLKLEHDGILKHAITSYLPIFLFVTVVQISYVILLHGILAKFNISRWYEYVRNMVPAFIAGFSSMSSAAAMPLTLLGVEKNTGNPTMTRALVPATVNIHMIGNATTVPILALAVMNTFGMPFPPFADYIMFALLFGIAQFAVAAVPGGGILVMLPIMEKYLGFTPEMISFITAIYLLFDPNITGTNIVGNSAIGIFLTRIFKKLRITG